MPWSCFPGSSQGGGSVTHSHTHQGWGELLSVSAAGLWGTAGRGGQQTQTEALSFPATARGGAPVGERVTHNETRALGKVSWFSESIPEPGSGA